MVCDQGEISAVEVLMKSLYTKNQGQCLFLDLCVVLSLSERVRDAKAISFSLATIGIDM